MKTLGRTLLVVFGLALVGILVWIGYQAGLNGFSVNVGSESDVRNAAAQATAIIERANAQATMQVAGDTQDLQAQAAAEMTATSVAATLGAPTPTATSTPIPTLGSTVTVSTVTPTVEPSATQVLPSATPGQTVKIFVLEDGDKLGAAIQAALNSGLTEAGYQPEVTLVTACPASFEEGSVDIAVIDATIGTYELAGRDCIEKMPESAKVIVHATANADRSNVKAALNAAPGSIFVHKSDPFNPRDGLIPAIVDLLK